MSRARLPLELQWRTAPSLGAPRAIARDRAPTPLLVQLPPVVEHLDTWGRLAVIRAWEAARAEQRRPLGIQLRLDGPRDVRQAWINAFRRGAEDLLARLKLPFEFMLGPAGPLMATLAVQAEARLKPASLPRPGQKLWLTRPLGSDVLVEAYHQQARTASQTRQWLEGSARPGPPGPLGERALGVQVGLEGLAGAAARLAISTDLDAILDAGALPAWPGALEHLFAGVQPDSCRFNARALGKRFLAMRGVSERAAELALGAEWTGGILWASEREEKGVCVGELRKPRQKPGVRLSRGL